MATTQTLRPNALRSYGGGGGTPTPGPLADNNDGTYHEWFIDFGGQYGSTDMHMDSYTIAGNQRVAGVRARVRGNRFAGGNNLDVALEEANGLWLVSNSVAPTGGWQEIATAYRTTNDAGTEWLQADVDAISVAAGSYASWKISEMYADLDVRTRATVSITSPTAAQKVPTNNPTIFWNYNNQGDTVSRWHLKIFTAAVVTGGGFDPTTSPTAYDSSATAGAATSKQVTTALTPGVSYYAYVRIATDFNGTDWWSDWSSVQFSVSQLPVVSAISTSPASPITTTPYPFITGTYTDPDGETSQYFNVRVFSQAQYDAGGFNPDTTTPAWEHPAYPLTVNSGASFSVLITQALSTNTNYKAWVRASETGAGQRWGNWASSASPFLIQTAPGVSNDPPAQPRITATADQINQRVILDLEARDNLLTRNQASIDSGTVGWEVSTGASTLTRDSTNFFQGGGALQWTATAASSTVRTIGGQAIPVLPNRTYSFGGRVRAPVASRNARLRVTWYTSAGATIGSIINGTSTALTSGSFTDLTNLQAVSPATAAYVQLSIEVTNAVAAEVYRADNMFISLGTLTAWSRGGLAAEIGALNDSFNRADGALGNADIGGAWTVVTGTWSILSNKARMTAVTVDAYAVLTSDYLADGYIEADLTLSTVRANVGLAFRFLDVNNTLLIELSRTASSNNINLYKRSAGTWFTLATTGMTAGLVLGQTYKVRVEFYGGQIYVYVDGVLRLSYLMLTGELDQFGSYNKYGMFVQASATMDDNASRFDNFKAGAPATQKVTVERSLDGGETWLPLRDLEEVTLNQQVGIFYDYEVSLYTIPQYRMQTFGTEVTEQSSPYSAVAALDQQLVATSWWLKDPVAPELNTPVKVMPPFNFSRKEPQQVYEPLGRKTSVVVTDGPRGISGTLNLMTKSKAEYDKINQLIDNGRPLMLVDVFGRSWYIKFGESHDWTMVTAVPTQGEVYPVRHLHTVSLPFVEVSPP